MTLAKLVSAKKWEEVDVEIDGEKISFVVFPWDDVKAREEDGSENVWEYFIGFDGPVFDKVESGEWTPFGAGNMYAGALKYDGGFQESGHRGMLFSTKDGKVVYYDHNDSDAGPSELSVTVADLG
jgi:hypothetical protein